MAKKYTDLHEQGIGGALVSGIASGLRSGRMARDAGPSKIYAPGRLMVRSGVIHPGIVSALKYVAENYGVNIGTRVNPESFGRPENYGQDAWINKAKQGGWQGMPYDTGGLGLMVFLSDSETNRNINLLNDHDRCYEIFGALNREMKRSRLHLTIDTSYINGGALHIHAARGTLEFPFPYNQKWILQYPRRYGVEELHNKQWFWDGERTGTVRVPRNGFPPVHGTGQIPRWLQQLEREML